ncbi:MAG: methyltransferase domain-containing protein [Siculibacillus sp.]|nr:methyltransferase domain-containing protein [Siculibacillus sp.]
MIDHVGEPAEKWFHALRLPGGEVTPGRFPPHRPPSYTLYGEFAFLARLDLRRAGCLDIGTMDGLGAFAMPEAGAARVRATDIAPRPTFERARAALAPRVEYETPVSISDMGAVVTPAWDLIACCGVLHHVFDPLTVLATLHRNLREGGLLLLETQYLPVESRGTCPSRRRSGMRERCRPTLSSAPVVRR